MSEITFISLFISAFIAHSFWLLYTLPLFSGFEGSLLFQAVQFILRVILIFHKADGSFHSTLVSNTAVCCVQFQGRTIRLWLLVQTRIQKPAKEIRQLILHYFQAPGSSRCRGDGWGWFTLPDEPSATSSPSSLAVTAASLHCRLATSALRWILKGAV